MNAFINLSDKMKMIITILLLITFLSGVCSADLSVDIIKPKEKAEVQWREVVEGKYSAENNSQMRVYVLIWPIEANGPWWVQPNAAMFSDNTWRIKAYFGGDPNQYPGDIGTAYKITAILTNESLESGQTIKEKILSEYPIKSDEVIVVRA